MADNTETLASLAQRLNEQNEMLKGTRKTILRLLEQIRATDAVCGCLASVVVEKFPELKQPLIEEIKSVKIVKLDDFPDYVDGDFGITSNKALAEFLARLSR